MSTAFFLSEKNLVRKAAWLLTHTHGSTHAHTQPKYWPFFGWRSVLALSLKKRGQDN